MTAADLEPMRDLAVELGLGTAALERLDSARSRLAAGVFRIAVAGEPGAGKSLLLNALLGAGVLPCSAVPCTAVPTRIAWGETPAAAVLLRGSPQSKAVRELAPFVTRLHPAFAERAAAAQEAVVHSPLPLLHPGVELFDLPGSDPETAAGALRHEVHAVLLALAVDAPASDALAARMARLLRADLGWVGVVVTKLDRVPGPEQDEAVRQAAERLREAVRGSVGREAPGGDGERVLAKLSGLEVFGVSARQALQAKLAGDAALLSGSGLPRLESGIAGLASSGREEALRRIAASALSACGREALRGLDASLAARRERGEALGGTHRTGSLLFEGLQGMARQEMARIDAASLRAGTAAKNLSERLPERIREAVSEALAETPLAEADLDRSRSGETEARLGRRLSSAVGKAVQKTAEEIQMQAHEERLAALDALHGFAVASDRIAEHLAARIAQAGGTAPPPVPGLTAGLREIWEADRKTAEQSAEEGRIASPSLAFGAGRIAACLAPPALPAVAAPPPEGLPPAGREVAWKTLYRTAVLARLEPELQAWRTAGEPQLAAWLAGRFEELKEEIGERLARSRARLDEICGPVGPAGEPGARARIEEILGRVG